jgi:hypothetical protein
VGGGVLISTLGDSSGDTGPSTNADRQPAGPTASTEAGDESSPAGEDVDPGDDPGDVTQDDTVDGATAGSTSLDPLDLGRAFENQGCTGDWLVILASTGEPRDYRSTLLPPLSSQPDSRYLRTDQSCSSFTQQADGNPIYAAYLGPFADQAEACAAREPTFIGDAYVRVLDAVVPSRDLCSCLEPPSALPVLDSTNASEPTTVVQYYVTDIQVMLVRAGFNPGNAIGGHYLELTTAMVTGFQESLGLPPTGTTDAQTWDALQDYCSSA